MLLYVMMCAHIVTSGLCDIEHEMSYSTNVKGCHTYCDHGHNPNPAEDERCWKMSSDQLDKLIVE